MGNRRTFTRTVGGKTEEVLVMVWEGVRIMRGVKAAVCTLSET